MRYDPLWVGAISADNSVLIVDDEESVLFYLREVLEAFGFVIHSASSYEEGANLAVRASFGVAIIDKNLPGEKTGLDLVRLLKDKRPLVRSMIHTGYPSKHSAIAALQLGAFDYLEKPIDNAMLYEKVRRAANAYKVDFERQELFENYESLFELIPGVVWFVTSKGVVERVSTQGANLLGYEPAELVGVGYADLVIDDDEGDRDGHWVFKERRTGSRANQRKLVRLRTRDDKERFFEMRSCGTYVPGSVHSDDNYKGTFAVGWDITDNVRLLEELQQAQKMDALGRLAGGVAHDLNNLLCIIGPSAQLLDDSLDRDHDGRAEVAAIAEAADRAAALTKHLLLFSRKQMVRPKRVGVSGVLERLKAMLGRVVREDVQTTMTIDDDVGNVFIDPHQLEQVVVNLVVNASDAMPDGGKLEVRAGNATIDSDYAGGDPRLRPGSYVLVSVTDTGKGIPERLRERVFEPFFTTKQTGKGTGLGLSIVYGIVNRACGFVSLYSEENIGTSVKVYLPRYESKEDAVADSGEVPVGSGNETILVVDDDDGVRRIASKVLQRAGYRVLESPGVDAALETLDGDVPVDLVLTDVVMPVRGGVDLAAMVRERDDRLPVLFMSGYPAGLSVADAAPENASAFIAKPFTSRALLTEVRRLLDA